MKLYKKIAVYSAVLITVFCFSACGKDTVKKNTEQPTSSVSEINESEIINSPIIDEACFDIDSDGIKENCTLSYGNTSGVYSVVITVNSDEGIKYKNIYYPSSGELKFAEIDGEYKIMCTVTDSETGEKTISYHDITVNFGTVFIDGLE